MRKSIFLFFLVLPITLMARDQDPGTRLIILADMGNEPDEEQQMMHMLMCCNEFDLEGLIAVTGKYLQPANKDPYRQVLHPELFHQLIDGYGEVHENLLKHSADYPEPDFLRSIVASGQKGYGIADSGPGKESEGSRLIVRAMEKDDPRPLYIVVNAGSNTLAQALKDFEAKHPKKEVKKAVAKLRIYENGAQDNSGAWICHRFPEIHWIRSNYQTYCYGGPGFEGAADGKGKLMNLGPHCWQPYEYSPLGQHQWALEHIMMQHGPFGPLFPLRSFHKGELAFIEGGGTVPWLCLVDRGLSDIERPWWGGWSGRFTRERVENYGSKHATVREDEKDFEPFYTLGEAEDDWTDPADGYQYEGLFVPVWRWRQAFFNDFQCRMDWCNKPYGEANHHPIAVLNGDASNAAMLMDAKAGEVVSLDGSDSGDPDGDKLEIRWFYYPEAGTWQGADPVISPKGQSAEIRVPSGAKGSEIHVIMEVRDLNSIASLYDYKRVVIAVK